MKTSLRHAGRIRLLSLNSEFICISCRSNPSFLSSVKSYSTAQRSFASERTKLPVTERLRSRIWGTTDPPGPKPIGKQETPTEAEERGGLEETENDGPTAESTRKATSRSSRGSQRGVMSERERKEWKAKLGYVGHKSKPYDKQKNSGSFVGFMREGALPVKARKDIPNLLRRVAVEILTLQQADKPLDMGAKAEFSNEELMENIDIVQNGDGRFALREQTPDLIDELLEVLTRQPEFEEETAMQVAEEQELSAEEQEVVSEVENRLEEQGTPTEGTEEAHKAMKPDATEATVEAFEAEETAAEDPSSTSSLEEDDQSKPQKAIQTVASTKTHDSIYLSLPVTDLAFKFALTKRLTYLLGARIPDFRLSTWTTLRDTMNYLSEKPAPKKLAEILTTMPELQDLPNVEVFADKQGFPQKEMSLGRWKLIEAELKRRGLPVRRSDKVVS